MNNNEIIAYQRLIMKSLFLHEYVKDENKAKLEILEKIVQEKLHLFTPIQRDILKKALEESNFFRSEGNYSDWFMSEIFFYELTSEEQEEMLEIEAIPNQPLIPDAVNDLLGRLENKFLLRKAI